MGLTKHKDVAIEIFTSNLWSEIFFSAFPVELPRDSDKTFNLSTCKQSNIALILRKMQQTIDTKEGMNFAENNVPCYSLMYKGIYQCSFHKQYFIPKQIAWSMSLSRTWTLKRYAWYTPQREKSLTNTLPMFQFILCCYYLGSQVVFIWLKLYKHLINSFRYKNYDLLYFLCSFQKIKLF